MSAPFHQHKSPLVENFSKRWRQQCRELESYAKVNWADADPETVHQARVLSRRMRATHLVLAAAQPGTSQKFLLDPARAVTKTLRSARSWDVSYHWLAEEHLGKKWTGRELKFLSKAFAVRAKHKRKKIQFPSLGPLQVWGNMLKNLSESQLNHALTQLDESYFSSLLQKVGDFLKTSGKSDLHQVRIALKKWRYHQEILADCYEEEKDDILKHMKQSQALLGRFNDWVELFRHLKNPKILNGLKKSSHWRGYQDFFRNLKKHLKRELSKMHEFMERDFSRWMGKVAP